MNQFHLTRRALALAYAVLPGGNMTAQDCDNIRHDDGAAKLKNLERVNHQATPPSEQPIESSHLEARWRVTGSEALPRSNSLRRRGLTRWKTCPPLPPPMPPVQFPCEPRSLREESRITFGEVRDFTCRQIDDSV